MMKKYLYLLLPVLTLTLYLCTRIYAFSILTTSFSCIIMVIFIGAKNCMKTLYVAFAFLFSIAGDFMLGHAPHLQFHFIYGVGLFFMAHVCYISYALQNGRINWKFLFLLTAGFLIYYLTTLMPAIDHIAINIAVLLYTLISCLSIAAAAGLKSRSKVSNCLFLSGICCLAFSDTLISLNVFLSIDAIYFLMLPTYYASQILVTASLISYPADD